MDLKKKCSSGVTTCCTSSISYPNPQFVNLTAAHILFSVLFSALSIVITLIFLTVHAKVMHASLPPQADKLSGGSHTHIHMQTHAGGLEHTDAGGLI